MNTFEIKNLAFAKRIAIAMIALSTLTVAELIREDLVELEAVRYIVFVFMLLGMMAVLALTIRNVVFRFKGDWIVFLAIVFSLSAITLVGNAFILEIFVDEPNPFNRIF